MKGLTQDDKTSGEWKTHLSVQVFCEVLSQHKQYEK